MSEFHETKIPLWLKGLIGLFAILFVALSLWATASLNKDPKQVAKYQRTLTQGNFRAPAPEVHKARMATSYLEYLPVKPAAWARDPALLNSLFKWISYVAALSVLVLIGFGVWSSRRVRDDHHDRFIEELYTKRFLELKQAFMKLLGRV